MLQSIGSQGVRHDCVTEQQGSLYKESRISVTVFFILIPSQILAAKILLE